MEEKFHARLRRQMDKYVDCIYSITRKFPREELYGATSQFRRAVLSVVLNYIEGYARKRRLVKINFFEISYGSLQESRYLLEFSRRQIWISDEDYNAGLKIADEIGAMLWRTIENLEKIS